MSEKNFDNKNSRTALTYGKDMVNRIKKISILILGMRGLGVEIAKNLILCGPKEVYIYDKKKVELNDLGANFYLNEDSINKPRDEAVLENLKNLNKDVKVNIYKNEKFEQIDIYICTEIYHFDLIKKFEKQINSSQSKFFIYCGVMGLSGFIFNNFGKNFKVKNENGEPPKTYFIKKIIKAKNTKINIDITNENIELNINNMIEISEVKGMEEINGKKCKILKFENSDTIITDLDSENFNEYERGGLIKEVKIEKNFDFTSFIENLKDNLKFSTFFIPKEELNKKLMTILFIYSLNEFYNEYKKLPPLLNEFSAINLTLRTKAMYLKYKEKELFNS